MLALTHAQWTRLYKEVLHIALSITRTHDPKQAYTQRDRAREAVQKACLRYLERNPAGLETIDALREYLLGGVRSSLGHADARAAARRENEGLAVAEQATITGVAHATTRSAEAMNLAKGERIDDAERASRLVRGLEKWLMGAGDTLAVGTLQCIGQGMITPEQQARHLNCDVEAIYAARKRRKRAMEQVLATIDGSATDATDVAAAAASKRGT